MATSSYIDSNEPKLAELQQSDYVDHWVGLTVEEEVSRGSRLRDIKTLAPKEGDKYCKLVNANNNANPFCPDPRPKVRRKSPRKRVDTGVHTNPANRQFSPARASTLAKNPSHGSSPSLTYKLRKYKKCPLRIAELAAPTKRQCMATCKSKAHQLPDFMVERLKFHIMDQGPIAKVHDAVECFKRHKAASSKSKRSKDTSTAKKEAKESRKMMELRCLCLQFGGKVAEKLSHPLELTLLPELQKLADIVYYEIDTLFRSHKRPIVFYEAVNYKKMQRETSAKVAVWITTILDQVSIRMMEEEVRAKAKSETDGLLMKAKAEADGLLIDFIQDKLSQPSGDLEDEEGPALDVLDSLVENVMDLCAPNPQQNTEDNYSVSSQEAKTVIMDHDVEINNQDLDEEINNQDLNKEIINQDFNEQEPLKDVASTNDKDRLDIVEDEASRETSKGQLDQTQNVTEAGGHEEVIVEDKVEDKEVVDPEQEAVVEPEQEAIGEPDQDAVEIKDAPVTSQEADEVIDTLINNDANVSDDFVVVDERKTVAFFSNAEVRGDSIDTNVDNDSRINIEMFIEKLKHPPQPITYPKPDVDLAVPNEHLLSDADESWPEEPSTMMKRIASVVKSVASLGMITEKEGKYPNTTEEDDLQLDLLFAEESIDNTDLEKDSTKQSEDMGDAVLKQIIEKPSTDLIGSGLELYPLGRVLTKTESMLSTASCHEIDTGLEKGHIDTEKEDGQNAAENLPDIKEEISTTSATYKVQNNKGKGDHNDLESEKNLIFEAIRQKLAAVATDSKVDYKVHPGTAPAWALRNNSSDESIHPKQKRKTKLTQYELRKWCMDLDRTVMNLEQWNNWMENTCMKMFLVRQNAEANKVFFPNKKKAEIKEWSKLKKNLDREAILWTKLKHRTTEALKAYTFTSNSQNVKRNPKGISAVPCNTEEPPSILEMMEDIDRQSLLLHRMIVSTEYCTKCNCKNYSKEGSKPKQETCLKLPKLIGKNVRS